MPQEPLTDFQLGNQCLAQGNYRKAIEFFLSHAHNQPPERADAYARAAECYKRSNIVTTPAPVARGVTLVSAGDLKSAERYYRLALEADPNHFNALRGLAALLPEGADERLSILERASDIQPNFMVLINLGDFYRTQRKDFARAYDTYRRARQVKPRDKCAYLRLNDICRRIGKPDEAAEWSNKWKEVNAARKALRIK